MGGMCPWGKCLGGTCPGGSVLSPSTLYCHRLRWPCPYIHVQTAAGPQGHERLVPQSNTRCQGRP